MLRINSLSFAVQNICKERKLSFAKAMVVTVKSKTMSVIVSAATIAAMVIVAAVCIGFMFKHKPLGNLNHKYSSPQTGASDITFTLEAGDRIKFSLSSEVVSGDVDMLLYDSQGNLVEEFDRAREMETFLTVKASDTYMLQAQYNQFVGRYKATVYAWNKV